MLKKLGKICIISIIVVVMFGRFLKQPKLVTCITTMDQAYLTILVNPLEVINVEKLEEKISWMCKNDAFETIKFRTKEREPIKCWHVTVYTSRYAMEKGVHGVTIEVKQ